MNKAPEPLLRCFLTQKHIDVAALGMNMLILYTEDMFELEGHPKFGYLRGRYSLDELREVDDYGYEMGVELIPGLIREFDTFYNRFYALWRKSYKGFGLEIYTHDFGGAMLRLKDTAQILQDYLAGKTSSIEELETETIHGINKTWRSSASYISRFRY